MDNLTSFNGWNIEKENGITFFDLIMNMFGTIIDDMMDFVLFFITADDKDNFIQTFLGRCDDTASFRWMKLEKEMVACIYIADNNQYLHKECHAKKA